MQTIVRLFISSMYAYRIFLCIFILVCVCVCVNRLSSSIGFKNSSIQSARNQYRANEEEEEEEESPKSLVYSLSLSLSDIVSPFPGSDKRARRLL